jgi:hypothetical protein
MKVRHLLPHARKLKKVIVTPPIQNFLYLPNWHLASFSHNLVKFIKETLDQIIELLFRWFEVCEPLTASFCDLPLDGRDLDHRHLQHSEKITPVSCTGTCPDFGVLPQPGKDAGQSPVRVVATSDSPDSGIRSVVFGEDQM